MDHYAGLAKLENMAPQTLPTEELLRRQVFPS